MSATKLLVPLLLVVLAIDLTSASRIGVTYSPDVPASKPIHLPPIFGGSPAPSPVVSDLPIFHPTPSKPIHLPPIFGDSPAPSPEVSDLPIFHPAPSKPIHLPPIFGGSPVPSPEVSDLPIFHPTPSKPIHLPPIFGDSPAPSPEVSDLPIFHPAPSKPIHLPPIFGGSPVPSPEVSDLPIFHPTPSKPIHLPSIFGDSPAPSPEVSDLPIFHPAPSPSPVISLIPPFFGDSPAPSPVPFFPRIFTRYKVIDNSTSPGNTRFEEIGKNYALNTLRLANEFVLKVLGQKFGEGKYYEHVVLVVESFANARIGLYPGAVASTVDNSIRFNSDYLQEFSANDAKTEFTGVLYHESTHVWQYTGQGSAPKGLINGIADFVRLSAGWPAFDWVKRGSGKNWDDGYEVTAYFLHYCEGKMGGFVAKLNAMMKDCYSDDYFRVLLGKSVDELWNEYKFIYGWASSWTPTAPAPAPGY